MTPPAELSKTMFPVEGVDEEDLAKLNTLDEWVTLKRNKRPDLVINRRSIYKLAAAGSTALEISAMLGVNHTSFYDNFKEDFQLGKASIAPRLKALVIKRAQTSDKILQFAAKNYAGMSEDPVKDAQVQTAVEWTASVPKPAGRRLSKSEQEELDNEA
jgi:hypothetical protein